MVARDSSVEDTTHLAASCSPTPYLVASADTVVGAGVPLSTTATLVTNPSTPASRQASSVRPGISSSRTAQ